MPCTVSSWAPESSSTTDVGELPAGAGLAGGGACRQAPGEPGDGRDPEDERGQQHEPRGVEHRGLERHGQQTHDHRDRERGQHPQQQILDRVDVADQAGQQLAAAECAQAGRRERLDALVDPHPQPCQDARRRRRGRPAVRGSAAARVRARRPGRRRSPRPPPTARDAARSARSATRRWPSGRSRTPSRRPPAASPAAVAPLPGRDAVSIALMATGTTGCACRCTTRSASAEQRRAVCGEDHGAPPRQSARSSRSRRARWPRRGSPSARRAAAATRRARAPARAPGAGARPPRAPRRARRASRGRPAAAPAPPRARPAASSAARTSASEALGAAGADVLENRAAKQEGLLGHPGELLAPGRRDRAPRAGRPPPARFRGSARRGRAGAEITVDLPHPLGPASARISPGWIVRSRSRRAGAERPA